jgi:RNA polymerase sigma factor (sigma-70 family)
MTKTKTLNQQDFDKLLNWLDSDRELAGQKYESIRQRLIKIFDLRGCAVSEELADKTFDRVIQKLDDITDDFDGNPAPYFYAVGKNILLEYFKLPKTEELSPLIPLPPESESVEEAENYKCLKICLQTLKSNQRELIIEYYSEDKRAKIDSRKFLAQKLGATQELLRTQTFRIRNKLQKCIKSCMDKV